MRKIEVRSIPLIIGCANWIIVVIILAALFTGIAIYPKGTPEEWNGMIGIIAFYLQYSFVPALVSLVLTIVAKKGDRTVNFAINFLFLFLFTIVYLFVRHMIRSA